MGGSELILRVYIFECLRIAKETQGDSVFLSKIKEVCFDNPPIQFQNFSTSLNHNSGNISIKFKCVFFRNLHKVYFLQILFIHKPQLPFFQKN